MNVINELTSTLMCDKKKLINFNLAFNKLNYCAQNLQTSLQIISKNINISQKKESSLQAFFHELMKIIHFEIRLNEVEY